AASGGSLRTLRDGRRLYPLCRPGELLFERLDTEVAFRPFLQLVARMLDATAAEIVIVRDGHALVHDASGTVSVAPQPTGLSGFTADGYRRARSGSAVHAATIGTTGDEMGSLVAFRRTPLS